MTEISCVVPAFENLDLLARCLTSVAAQKEVDLEIVVTDDSRSDLARDFVAGLARGIPSIRYLEGPRTGNPVDNWNHGLDAAAGRYCVLVHHDEYLIDPFYLRRAVDRLDQTKATAVLGRVEVIGVERVSRFGWASAAARLLGRPVWLLPILNWIGPTAAFAFRRGPRFDPALVQWADVEFYRRVLNGGQLERLDEVCVGSLGHHPAQISATIDPLAAARRELALLAARSPASINPLERAIFAAGLGVRSWLG